MKIGIISGSHRQQSQSEKVSRHIEKALLAQVGPGDLPTVELHVASRLAQTGLLLDAEALLDRTPGLRSCGGTIYRREETP